VKADQLEDLSDRLFKGGTASVPAIFNEAWHLMNGNGHGGHVSDSAGNILFSVIQGQGELKVKPHKHNATTLHAITLDITALKQLSKASTAPQAENMYLRFRVKDVPIAFYRVGINQGDRMLLSSSQRTEIIDFRLNVRRGAPLGLERSVGGTFVTFEKVHLFLMKSRSHDIVFEDKLFKACRSLEDEKFWASYSLSKEAGWWANIWTKWRVSRSLGYQWTKLDKDAAGKHTPITEYSILARFKNLRLGILWFILSVLAFGAAGNALWDGVKLRYADTALGQVLQGIFTPPPPPPPATGSAK
jgi:hypothetical protein